MYMVLLAIPMECMHKTNYLCQIFFKGGFLADIAIGSVIFPCENDICYLVYLITNNRE